MSKPGLILEPLSKRRSLADRKFHLASVAAGFMIVMITHIVPAQLPSGWTDADIGGPGIAGSASVSANTWTVAGGGSDIWNTSDLFNFAYENAGGSNTIIARVISIQNTDPWAKAGVMFRDSADPSSVFVNVVITPGNGVNFQYRPSYGGQCGYSQVGGITVPVWVKLVRSNNDFSGFYSPDGSGWTQIGSSTTVPMSTTPLVGLAVTAHNNAALNTASFNNVTVTNVAPPPPPPPPVFGIYRELWTGLPAVANTMDMLTNTANNPNWPNNPDSSFTKVFTNFETEVNSGMNYYGQRLRTFIVPPTNGNYTFWISSDDASQLFVSTDEGSANMNMVASVTGWANPREWTKEPNQQSAPVSLEAGRRYYTEARMQQGQGGDNLAVRWQLPDGSFEEPMAAQGATGTRLVPYDGVVTQPGIYQQPTNVTVIEGQNAFMSILATNHALLSYQWRRYGTNLIGSSKPFLTVSNVSIAGNDGQLYSCVLSNSVGSVTSAPIVLSVIRDTVPPTVVRVVNIGTNAVLVMYSKTVELASATNKANYAFTDGLPVNSGALSGDLMSVTLATGALVYGSNYSIIINNVRDRASTPNTIAANTTVSFTASPYTTQDIGNPTLVTSIAPAGNGFNVTASGSDVGGNADQFGLSYQLRTGDFDVAVRVAALAPSDVWAKAGLMAREALDAGARFAAVFTTPAMNGSFFEWRDPANGAASVAGNFPANYPSTWLRLKRAGNVFTGFSSYDGQTWTQLSSATISMPSQIYFGFAVSSHASGQSTTVQFRDLADLSSAVVGVVTNPHEPLGPCSRKSPIVISEIMYKPAPRTDGNNVEFAELYNSNPWFQDISGYQLISGSMNYTFPAGTILSGGAFVVIAASPAGVQNVYGITGVLGPYTGSLKKSDSLRLLDEQGAVLLTVPYSNVYPWPVAADGTGHSLILANPTYGEGDPRAWDISDVAGGSPGQMDAFHPSVLRNIVINEFLAHTDPPDYDYVELYNHGNQPVDISGCILTDDPATNKFVIPSGTIISPRGFIAFSANYWTNLNFRLSALGESVFLKNPDASRCLDAVQFGGQQNGVVTGRWPDGANDFYRLTTKTPGTNNAPILLSEVVINELMYDPISGNDDDQYVELYNRSTNTVDLGGWTLSDAVSFSFPSNTVLRPDNYLVVARNAPHLRTNYPNLNLTNCLGNFTGKLSHSGEHLALNTPDSTIQTNAQGVGYTVMFQRLVNDLTYGSGGRWGQWAAGGGSSLELTDPNSNNRLAANWADSDETQKSSWVNIETTGVLDNGANYDPSIDYAQIGQLDAGECLVDNLEVYAGAGGVNLVSNPDFESVGLANWSLQGDHSRSSLENAGYASAHSLHIRCSDRIWTGDNSAQVSLNANSLAAGQTATLRFKARWLRGWPELLLRLNGNWLEAAGAMPVPANLGTPGARNSRYVSNAGPAIYSVKHNPPVPAVNQPVLVTTRVHDFNGVASLSLYYRVDPGTTYTALSMKDDGTGGDAIAGDGLWSATIPGQLVNTVVAFYIGATDSKGATARFPALLNDNAPVHECIVMFGDGNPSGSFPVYHLWITQTNATRWSNLSDLSNESHDCTIVNGTRVIYNAQARFAGSPYHQGFDTPYGSLCHYKWIFPDDDAFLGETSFNKIHQPGNGAGDDTSLQREQLANTFLRALGVPWLNRHDVIVYVNGNRRGGIMEDAQTPDGDVVKEYFPNDANGWLYKMQPWFEFGPFPQGVSIPFNNESWCNLMPYTTTGGAKKLARYRYNFLIRRTPTSANDFTNVFTLVDAASTYGAPGYVANMENVADMENWMRVFAANHAAGNWDAFGCQNAQNLYGYMGTLGTRYTLMMFDFNIVIGNSGSWGPGQNLFAVNGSDSNTQNIYNEPTFRRMYWRALQELVNGPLDVSKTGPLLDAKYNAFAANGIAAENPNSSIKSWLSQAHDSIAGQIATENALGFSVNSSVTVSNDVAYVTGSAPVNVRTVWINGAQYPLAWTSVTGFTIAVPLRPGSNPLSIVGVDKHDQPIIGASNFVSVAYAGSLPSPVGQIVLNEIMDHPVVSGAEYVELYNNSSTITFDLSGYQFKGLSYTFPAGSTIGPTNYLILAADPPIFATTYGPTIPVFDTFSGTLQTDGETLRLIKPGTNSASDLLIAGVKYETGPPWPANASGTSLQLVDRAQDNSRVANWAVGQSSQAPPQWVYFWTNGTASSSTLYIYLQTAGEVYMDDLRLVAGTTPDTGTNLVADGDFESTLSGPWTSTANFASSALTMAVRHSGNSSLHVVATTGGSGSGNAISQAISPGLSIGQPYSLSFWYLQSANGGPLTVRLSNSGVTSGSIGIAPPATVITALATPGAANSIRASLPAFPPIWINELQAENLTGITNRAGQRAAWLELYNPTTNLVSLAGVYLSDNYANPAQWAFPAGTVIGPGQFKVIFADGQIALSNTNEPHTTFALHAGAGSLTLSRLNNGQLQVLDYINYTNLLPNHSFGSFPDGQNLARAEFFFATPGNTNDNTVPASFIAYATAGSAYTQNFDSLPNPGPASVNCDNPVTINGLTYSLQNPFDFALPAVTSGNSGGLGVSNLVGWYGCGAITSKFGATDGDQTTGGVLSFGLPSAANRALGLLATSSTGGTAFGAKFINQTAVTLTSFNLQFTGEVWRQSNLPKTLAFHYAIDPAGTNAFPTNYSAALPSLNVTFPSVPADVNGVPMDGTAAANQANLGVMNQAIANWSPGAALWLVWEMTDAAGKAQGLAIDNLTFSATPQNQTNTAPILASIPDQTVNANSLLAFTASATDTDQPPQSLTFTLGAGAPVGASITPSGVLSWQPTSAQAPSTNVIAVTVTDNGVPPLSDSQSFTVVVSAANAPPALAAIPGQNVYANTLLAFTTTATDPDQPQQSLAFSLGAGAPAGASITSGGAFSWTPTSAQALSTNVITVVVTDNGVPPLSDNKSFTVVVYRPNTPPVLTAISNQTVYANSLLTFSASATDTDQPPQSLTFLLGTGAPAGASITSGGVFSWTPSAAQAPSTNAMSVIVRDSGVPQMSATNSVSVVVYRPNTSPKLATFTNLTAFANALLTFTVSATDTDQPPQALTFTLGPGAPAGAGITTNGVFSWTPATAQALSTNIITVLVTDSGIPPLSDSSSFTVIVSPELALQASADLRGPFTDDPTAVIDTVRKTITASVGTSARFYQLRSSTALRILQIQIVGNQILLHYQ